MTRTAQAAAQDKLAGEGEEGRVPEPLLMGEVRPSRTASPLNRTRLSGEAGPVSVTHPRPGGGGAAAKGTRPQGWAQRPAPSSVEAAACLGEGGVNLGAAGRSGKLDRCPMRGRRWRGQGFEAAVLGASRRLVDGTPAVTRPGQSELSPGSNFQTCMCRRRRSPVRTHPCLL